LRVAPHAGAWIETSRRGRASVRSYGVAPHAGAWIETVVRANGVISVSSRPTRARGLKLLCGQRVRVDAMSRPTRARGLKLVGALAPTAKRASRPTRARGLKQHH